jgi:hypothetical protein
MDPPFPSRLLGSRWEQVSWFSVRTCGAAPGPRASPLLSLHSFSSAALPAQWARVNPDRIEQTTSCQSIRRMATANRL